MPVSRGDTHPSGIVGSDALEGALTIDGACRRAKGRFAPSPSGRMHIGNLYSFLVAWLVAKSTGASLVLRIEDLDEARCKQSWALPLHWRRDVLTVSLLTTLQFRALR